ncbi:MAG TPA: hypothetical protein VKV04_03990, partial [Verrucomicrobiae bacterium]|nr:hypothetical protein [Verrucomicrobiae bacterium]
MRLSIKLLAVLLFAITLAVVWPGGNASLNHSPVSNGPDSRLDSISGPNARLASRRGMFRRVDPDPLAATMISLRTKMRQWQDSLMADADNEEERARLLQEMLALVTDENVAQVVQSLSVEEMNTDFGSGALHHWMQADPVNATDWLATRAGTTLQQTLSAADDWIARQQG